VGGVHPFKSDWGPLAFPIGDQAWGFHPVALGMGSLNVFSFLVYRGRVHAPTIKRMLFMPKAFAGVSR